MTDASAKFWEVNLNDHSGAARAIFTAEANPGPPAKSNSFDTTKSGAAGGLKLERPGDSPPPKGTEQGKDPARPDTPEQNRKKIMEIIKTLPPEMQEEFQKRAWKAMASVYNDYNDSLPPGEKKTELKSTGDIGEDMKALKVAEKDLPKDVKIKMLEAFYQAAIDYAKELKAGKGQRD